VTEYAWDIRDRLTGITVKNAGGAVIKSANYKYDVYDQRISKTVDLDGAGVLAATTEKYVYGSNQNIALEFDGSNNLTHRYLFGDGIDQIEADESNGTVLWGLVDHLGSVRDVVDNSGTVKNHISYDSFGNITAQADSSVVFRYGYTGREFDSESGQYYYRSRYYDPTVGKFISEDLIGFGGGDLNLNRYVGNNPVGLSDPSGFAAYDPNVCKKQKCVYKSIQEAKNDFFQKYGSQFNNCLKSVFSDYLSSTTISQGIAISRTSSKSRSSSRPSQSQINQILTFLPNQTSGNTPSIDVSLTRSQLGPADGKYNPNNNKVYLASDLFCSKEKCAKQSILQTIGHELGNYVAQNFANDLTIGNAAAQLRRTGIIGIPFNDPPFGNPNDPFDTDAGVRVERCMFGRLLYDDCTSKL
jgi:RHS repeat-associated protein